ncbi:glycosyltransferase family 2 protein [Ramlibacter sp. PS3R-8]|uniref:glycosyltransferase family 2 protein n=1 Tax=Ramlibacter sp. PS3R-8 TaxID=3133437 RepID=UPI0030AA1646
MNEAVHIAVEPRSAAGGWHLLQGSLRRQGGAYDARLYFDGATSSSSAGHVSVATSAKGMVNDLLWLPAGVQALRLDIGDAPVHELGAMRIRPVGSLERRWRMAQRVLAALWQQPAAKRHRLGLTWPRFFSDLAAAYELATRLRAHAPAPSYPDWIRRFDTLSDADRQAMRRQVASAQDAPFFHVLLAGAEGLARERSFASLQAQLHPRHRVTPWDPGSADAAAVLRDFNAVLGGADAGQWVLLLRAGDELPAHALFWFAHEALRRPDACMLYADEDEIDGEGQRRNPRFKPAWSWAHARSTRFFGEAVVLKAHALARAGGLEPDDARHGCYGAVLRVLDTVREEPGLHVAHIPSVLLHRGAVNPESADPWALNAVRAHLARRGAGSTVEPVRAGCWRVRHPLPAQPPLVSIIVPTRDALAITRLCIESVRRHTRYPRYEILLVDNQSVDADALAWMRSQQDAGLVRLLRYDAPFNYAAINNMAVQEAAGQLVCLLNNDTEVMEPGWLEEMVSHALQPGVDVVGAKLLYPNGLVQHGGDLVGVGGVANHAHAFLKSDDPGYCDRAVVAQEYSAVTAACMLTWRNRYLALGGLDAANLPVAFNDVDYCLRVRDAGGRVAWTPHAVLVHHESISRGKDLTRQQLRRAKREAAWMRRRWQHVLGRDPFYNPNLSHERPDFSLSHAPVVDKPWTS